MPHEWGFWAAVMAAVFSAGGAWAQLLMLTKEVHTLRKRAHRTETLTTALCIHAGLNPHTLLSKEEEE